MVQLAFICRSSSQRPRLLCSSGFPSDGKGTIRGCGHLWFFLDNSALCWLCDQFLDGCKALETRVSQGRRTVGLVGRQAAHLELPPNALSADLRPRSFQKPTGSWLGFLWPSGKLDEDSSLRPVLFLAVRRAKGSGGLVPPLTEQDWLESGVHLLRDQRQQEFLSCDLLPGTRPSLPPAHRSLGLGLERERLFAHQTARNTVGPAKSLSFLPSSRPFPSSWGQTAVVELRGDSMSGQILTSPSGA